MNSETTGFTVRELLHWVGGRVANADLLAGKLSAEDVRFGRPSALKSAQFGDIAFFFSREYQLELPTARPSVLLVGEPFVEPLRASGLPLLATTVIVACANPYLGMAITSEHLASKLSSVAHLPGLSRGETVIHPTAIVHPSVKVGRGVTIGAHCIVERDVVLGDGCFLYPSVYIGPGVRIGIDGTFFPRVTLYEWCQIGDRARFHAGVVIGADGFGYAPEMTNGAPSGHRKIYHLGRVVIGDDVEIGANSMVDRGTIADTRIDSKVKIDNECHVGHNSLIEEGSILCGGVGLAGGSLIGKYVYLAGKVGVGGRFKVGDRAKVGAMSGIASDVPPGANYFGVPARDHRSVFRLQSLLNGMLEDYEAKKKTKRDARHGETNG